MVEMRPYEQKWNAVLTITMEGLISLLLSSLVILSIISGIRPENNGASLFFLSLLSAMSASLCCSLFVLYSFKKAKYFWRELGCPIIDFGIAYPHRKRGVYFLFINPVVYPSFGLRCFHNVCRFLWLLAISLVVLAVVYAV